MITNLDPKIRQEYLDKHLPYRINSMLAHDLLLHRKTQREFDSISISCYGDSLVVEPLFEISLIFGRSLLNFLGISLDQSTNELSVFQPKCNDLTIKSLYPDQDFCPLDDQIILENKPGLCTLIKLANKSVAHLTSTIAETKDEDQNLMPSARIAIYKLMINHLPEIKKENIWWTNQGPVT